MSNNTKRNLVALISGGVWGAIVSQCVTSPWAGAIVMVASGINFAIMDVAHEIWPKTRNNQK